jgi:hypothetical protein
MSKVRHRFDLQIPGAGWAWRETRDVECVWSCVPLDLSASLPQHEDKKLCARFSTASLTLDLYNSDVSDITYISLHSSIRSALAVALRLGLFFLPHHFYRTKYSYTQHT